GPEPQAEAGSDQEVACWSRGLRTKQQRVEIGGEEQGAREQRPKRLQDEQLVVHIRAEDSDSLDAFRAVVAPFRVQLLQSVAEAPEIIELSLSLGAVPEFRAGRTRRGFLVALRPFLAFIGRVAARAPFGFRRLAVQATQIFEWVQPGLIG